MFETAVPDPVVLEDLPEEVKQVDAITVKWTEPKSNGASISCYKMYYRIVTTADKMNEWVKTKPRTLHLEQSVEVARGKAYEFVVTASNSLGESLKQNIKMVKVLGKLHMRSIVSFL